MKILYIHQHFATNRGSTGTRSYDYARYLVERGHQVHMLTGEHARAGFDTASLPGRFLARLQVDGIDVLVVRVPYANQMGAASRLLSFATFAAVSSAAAVLSDADVTFATSTPLTVGVPALVARFLRGRPYAFEVRDIWPEMLVNAGLLKNRAVIATATFAEETFYRFARRVVGISRGISDRLAERGVPRDKLRVLYTGVDLSLYEGVEPNREILRSLGLEGRFVAVYAGAHSFANDLTYVLDAAEALAGDPRVAFLLVGDGRDRDALMADAARRGLANVVFLPALPKTELVALLKACDAGLMILKDVPDFVAAMPNKFYDYLAAGLPVVVNFPGELAGHLGEHDCGVEVPAGDPAALGRALLALASTPEAERSARSRRARGLVEARFDRRALVDDLEQLLRETCA